MVKPIVFPAKFHQAFAKINFLIVPTVSYETSFSEKCINITGKIDGETYSEPSRTSKITLFGEIVNDFHSLTNFRKSSILVVQLGSKYVSGIFSLSCTIFLQTFCRKWSRETSSRPLFIFKKCLIWGKSKCFAA